MIEYLIFLFQVVVISMSGVMAPGPITTATIVEGSKSRSAGIFIALGHGVVEIPLILAIRYGLGPLFKLSAVKMVIGIGGGMVLLLMGISMVRDAKRVQEITGEESPRSPFVSGALLSAVNPYFLVWWATVGAALILKSVAFGVMGFVLFIAVHWLCDLGWYAFLSSLSFQGGKFLGERFQQGVFVVCGLFLVLFSFKFIFSSIALFRV